MTPLWDALDSCSVPELHPSLFPFQRDLVGWALRRGRAALFADTGLGKTRQELEWARCVAEATGGRVLILAPLAVGAQTVREAGRIGIPAKQVRYAGDIDAECPAIVMRWQRYASPVWVTTGAADDEGFLMCSAEETGDDASGINPSDTLQYRSAREHDDERHICPLQLGVIRRCVRLWSNPGEVVWSPFAGIGSEGYVALQEGRRFIGAELKKSYYEQAARNLHEAQIVRQGGLFDAMTATA